MIKNNLFLKNSIDSKFLNKKFSKKLSGNYQKYFYAVKNEIKNPKKTLHVLNSNFSLNLKIKKLNKFKKFRKIIIIGMGGSILGAEAIYDCFKKKIKKKIYFLNNLDEEKVLDLKTKINNKSLLLIISKSGNTIETLSNSFALKILKKNSKNIIIISEKKNNLLFSLAKKYKLFYIEHKNYIGGRYSVLSEVGLVPAYLMGININKLRSQLLNFTKGKEKNFLRQSSIQLANLLNSKKINNLIFLNYSPRLEKFLYWCQQLIAESLGKKNRGFLPVVSTVPKDHHSLLQLYLDGPKDKMFQIFSSDDTKKYIAKNKNRFNKKNPFKNRSITTIKNAQKNALISVFKKNRIPFREFKISEQNEEMLGALFSYFILETVLIGKLLNLNPFDQPAVEQVKTLTNKLLR